MSCRVQIEHTMLVKRSVCVKARERKRGLSRAVHVLGFVPSIPSTKLVSIFDSTGGARMNEYSFWYFYFFLGLVFQYFMRGGEVFCNSNKYTSGSQRRSDADE
jgi:hypothetical protein